MKQLAEIQEKRKGLQTVIAMFDGSGQAIEGAAAVIEDVAEETEASVGDAAEAAEAEPETPEVKVEDKSAKATKPKATAGKTKTAKAKTPQAKAAKKPAQAKKTNGRTADWQRYVLDDYRQQPLPNAVADFLKAKPKESFKIVDVMSALFEDDMPKTQFLKARNRISNILSAGAREKDWYRGRGGTYSLSAKAVKIG
ncbi:MAG: hypothetical protein F6J97_11765 [Leptolyngbya sp. SIO4C1]|nr:hypothetical protein [Leptolyngbya sp. SIO4C1]